MHNRATKIDTLIDIRDKVENASFVLLSAMDVKADGLTLRDALFLGKDIFAAQDRVAKTLKHLETLKDSSI